MSLLLSIPQELQELIFLCFRTPKDLLHLALTCRELYEKIIPVHLRFVDVSSDLRCSEFWTALNECPKLARRVRKLEVLDDDAYRCALNDGYKSGVRQNISSAVDQTIAASSSDQLTHSIHLFTSCLRFMTNLHFLALKQQMTSDMLHDILSVLHNPSIPLEGLSLNVDIQGYSTSMFSFPQPIVYHHLTSLALTVTDARYIKITETIFDFIVFRCPALTNLSLVSRAFACFCSPRFLKGGNWPSLRRLTLYGWLNLCPNDVISKSDLAISFFQRHPQLESIWIADAYSPKIIEEEAFLCRPAFPSLRSLCLTDCIPIQILDRLQHIEDLEQIPTYKFSQAKSLRSCTFAPRRVADVDILVKAVPRLERLAFTLGGDLLRRTGTPNSSHIPYSPCKAFDEIRQALSQFKHLTHLMVELLCHLPDRIPSLNDFICVIEKLPKLRYFQLAIDGCGPWYIIEREGQFKGSVLRYEKQTDSLFAEYHYQRWGDFFIGITLSMHMERFLVHFFGDCVENHFTNVVTSANQI
ncbi:hypothetical protein Clacol_005737 [Clathrus columnatus]|uniref:F-box domain-containing protein n=1 Tax=Clathrus columnatus TaxID=1419009 RepID=A0AAV5AA68_9AGAM|nr:hypothetical protein Clacol_005737 [Clathrus columnatus]